MTYFKDKFRSIFQVKDSPHHIALAFALGVFMGISPFLGLHYLSGFFFAWLFRLNKLVAMVGVTVSNPWTIVPISTFCAWVGAQILGIKQMLPEVDWGSISFTKMLAWLKSLVTDFDNVMKLINDLWPLIKAFFVGSMVVCTVSAIISYFIIHNLASRYQKT